MKYTTFCLIFAGLCLFSAIVEAQPRSALKAGANYGGLSGYSDGKKAGVHAGASMQWTAGKKWKIQPELMYSAMGQSYTTEESEVLVNNILTLHYAALPVMVQFHSRSKLFAEAGPQLSFLIAAKDKTSGGLKADVKRNLVDTWFGMNIGAGVMVSAKAGVYLRYHFGITDITIYDSDADRNRLVQAGVFLQLK